jgi:hypothetical protein
MARDRPFRMKKDGDNDGKKTMVIIAVLLLLIFAVGGGLLYMMTQKGGAPAVPQPNKTNATPLQNQTNQSGQQGGNATQNLTPTCDDSCLSDAAVASQDASACGAIPSEAIRQSCYERLSGVSLDACKAVLNESRRQSCVTGFAVSGNNATLCDALTAGRDECRKAVDPCTGAADAALCRALGARDPSLCSGAKECLVNYSIGAKDESGCSLISDAVVSAACKSAVKFTDKCSGFPADAQRDLCYELFAIYSGDQYTCTQISRGSKYVYECFTYFAIRDANLTPCYNERIDLNDKWACLRNVSLATGDMAGCKAIDPLASTNQYLCASEFAQKYGDPSACEIITILASRKTCYEGSIIYSSANLKWYNCQNVSNFVYKNSCFTEAAKLYKDVEICNNIGEDFARESCISSFEANQTKTN